MPRLRWISRKLDAHEIKDDLQFWKILIEAVVIGGSVGVLLALLGNTLGQNVLPSGSIMTPYAMVNGALIAVFWPKKWRFIR